MALNGHHDGEGMLADRPMVINGHFDGKSVILDEPLPGNLPPNTPVRVFFRPPGTKSALERLAELAHPGGKPADFAAQHEHYIKGTPKR